MPSDSSQTNLRVPFGTKDGRMVTPAEVPSGRACGCTCPGCGLPLLAKKGEQNAWHFAHDGTPCATGAETAVHLMAKQILAAAQEVELPAVDVTVTATDAFGQVKSVTATLAKPKRVRYASVELEVARNGRRPDAVGTTAEGVEHLIEVFVWHGVDDAKTRDLQDQGCQCYEIRLGDLTAYTSIERLRAAVTSSPQRVRWVSYPGIPQVRQRLMEKLQRILDASARRKRDEDAQARRAYAVQVRTRPNDRATLVHRKREQQARQEEKVARANAAFKRADDDTKRTWLTARLSLPTGPLPSVVNHKVEEAQSLSVPHDIWQADVYRRWIFSAGRQQISLEDVWEWLAQRYDSAGDDDKPAKVALWRYFLYLRDQGIVHHLGGQHFEVARDVAPWLEARLSVPGEWEWAADAETCSVRKLEAANASADCRVNFEHLVMIYQHARLGWATEIRPRDVARTVAQRIGVAPTMVLTLLATSGTVTRAPSERSVEGRRGSGHIETRAH